MSTISPFRRSFPFTRIFRAQPNALATETPTRSPVKDPGPVLTSISVISFNFFPCFFKSSTMKGSNLWEAPSLASVSNFFPFTPTTILWESEVSIKSFIRCSRRGVSYAKGRRFLLSLLDHTSVPSRNLFLFYRLKRQGRQYLQVFLGQFSL